MIAAFHHMEPRGGLHSRADFFQLIERAKWIARSLQKKNGNAKLEQYGVAQWAAPARRRQWIAEADDRFDRRLLQSNVTANATPHRFAGEDEGTVVARPGVGDGLAVGGNEGGLTVGRLFPTFHVGIIEGGDGSQSGEPRRPAAHPIGGRGSSGAVGEDDERFHVANVALRGPFPSAKGAAPTGRRRSSRSEAAQELRDHRADGPPSLLEDSFLQLLHLDVVANELVEAASGAPARV